MASCKTVHALYFWRNQVAGNLEVQSLGQNRLRFFPEGNKTLTAPPLPRFLSCISVYGFPPLFQVSFLLHCALIATVPPGSAYTNCPISDKNMVQAFIALVQTLSVKSRRPFLFFLPWRTWRQQPSKMISFPPFLALATAVIMMNCPFLCFMGTLKSYFRALQKARTKVLVKLTNGMIDFCQLFPAAVLLYSCFPEHWRNGNIFGNGSYCRDCYPLLSFLFPWEADTKMEKETTAADKEEELEKRGMQQKLWQ